MKYCGDASLMPFDPRLNAGSKASFTFATPPGLSEMEFFAYGLPEVTVDSVACQVTCMETRADGAALYLAVVPGGRRRSCFSRMSHG